MIVFLNFAPIEFMGGAERWVKETASMLGKKEKVTILSVAPEVSNIYAKFILHRNFEAREKSEKKNISIKFKNFIPFTKEYKKIKDIFLHSRIIYTKFEVNEIIILFYFCGLGVFKKVVGGVHSPLFYPLPRTSLEKFHNIVYKSFFITQTLKCLKLIHVITKRDFNYLTTTQKLTNVVFVPNFGNKQFDNTSVSSQDDNDLNILFIGELTHRKGVDILIRTIHNSPKYFKFHIAGNGEYVSEIKNLSKKKKNCIYYGYVAGSELKEFYKKGDLLFLPSRAEGSPLVAHEAFNNGLPLVNTYLTASELPSFMEYTQDSLSSSNFLRVFAVIKKLKEKKELYILKQKIKEYYRNHFSREVIEASLLQQVFI